MKVKHLFIVGAGRSGTTFLWRILNNSPEVHLCTEIHYFSSIYHKGFLKNFKKFRNRTNILNERELFYCLTQLDHFGMYWLKNPYFKIDEIKNYFTNKSINEKNIYEYLINHDLNIINKKKKPIKYIGEKTPLNIFHLKKILKWFPDSIILFIHRDPINVLKSEANKENKPDYPINKSNFSYNYSISLYVFIEWLLSSIIAIRYKYIKKNNFFLISYDSLISSTDKIISSLCSKIDIRFRKELYYVEKIDSSYNRKSIKSIWMPPFIIKIFFLCLRPLQKKLNNYSID